MRSCAASTKPSAARLRPGESAGSDLPARCGRCRAFCRQTSVARRHDPFFQDGPKGPCRASAVRRPARDNDAGQDHNQTAPAPPRSLARPSICSEAVSVFLQASSLNSSSQSILWASNVFFFFVWSKPAAKAPRQRSVERPKTHRLAGRLRGLPEQPVAAIGA